MRKTTILAAAAGLTVSCLGASGANALAPISPAGVRVATDAIESSTLVHCRPYRHWHPWGYGTGCHGGGVSVEVERGHRGGVEIERGRRGVEERSSIHSGTTTRGETSVRGSTSTKTDTKSGTSTTSKSGTSTGGSTNGGRGGETSSSGGMSGSSGGTSGGQSGGQKQ